MDICRLDISHMDALWELHQRYKAEIGEDLPEVGDRERLAVAINAGKILFYGAWRQEELVGCCSVMAGFSTFNYQSSGVFEDFYIRPEYRHRGIARELVRFACQDSGVASLTVGCADCDVPMYRALGFTVRLGNLFALDAQSAP